jgi:hypothetical protein
MSAPITPDVIVGAVCGKPIGQEPADTNMTGQPVHSRCYLEQQMKRQINPVKSGDPGF